MNYLFRIHPYLECDQQFCHWNLMLASEHLPYRKLVIYIHDPDDQIVEPSPVPDETPKGRKAVGHHRRQPERWAYRG